MKSRAKSSKKTQFLIPLCLCILLQWQVSAQSFWDTEFINPGAYSTSGDNINDMLATEDGVYITGYFGTIDGVVANSIAHWNGSTWENLGTGLKNENGSIAEGYELHLSENLLFVVGEFEQAGDSAVANIAAWDIIAKEWIVVPGTFNDVIRTVTSSGSNLYVGGEFTEIDGNPYDYIAVWDGESWNAFQGGVNGTVNVLKREDGQLYVGGEFSSANGLAVNNLAIWTGAQWTDFNGGADGEVFDIHIIGDSILVAGDFEQLNGASIPYLGILSEGIWASFAIQPDNIIYDIEENGSEIAIAGEFSQVGVLQTDGFAIWDGNNWSVPNNNLTSFSYLSTTLKYENSWIIGGVFTGNEFETLNNIAVFNDQSDWDKFGIQGTFNGVNGTVRAIEQDGDDYYVAGSFIAIGSTEIRRLAKWNGNNWEGLGEGPNSTIYDVLVDGDLIYVAGAFTTIGGISANRIAVWDKSTEQWSALGNGASSTVYSLLKIGNSIYAAGSFTSMNEAPANRIAEWNGNNWSALGDGTDGTINSIIEYNGKIYAGGNFNNAGAVVANNFAAWNGSVWENISDGLDGTVYALANTDTSIFIGGDFENSADGNADNIVEWISGSSTWKEVGNGFDDRVQSLLVKGDSLYAGGRFEKENAKGIVIIGGNQNQELNGLALWDNGEEWKSVGLGVSRFSSSSYNIYNIQVIDQDLFFGGSFDLAGETVSNNIAIWNEPEVPVSNEEDYERLSDYKLYQNYPNPFNPSTNIGFELAESGLVTLTVYNVLGQEVAQLLNTKMTKGKHAVSFNASNLPSGVYIYQLKTASQNISRKMLLIK